MTSSIQPNVDDTAAHVFDASRCDSANVATTCSMHDESGLEAIYEQQRQHVTTDVGDHVTSRAFRCTACERQFASRKYLSMHMALHKMAAEPLPPVPTLPPVAAVVGADVAAMAAGPIRHARHGDASQHWSCPVCGKTFAQNSNFRNHVRTHSDERPYVCLVCLIGFKERYHLKKHTLFKHSPGQLNEACRQCGKRFKDLTAVRAHERTHSDARPYACSRCDKTFKTSECLWHHENRSKTCGRVTSVGGGRNVAAGVPSSFRRRQRRSRVTFHEPSSTVSDAAPSTTEASAAVDTLLTHFVESSTAPNEEATVPSPANEVSTSDVRSTASFGVKPDCAIAELFDCDISDLWTTSMALDGVASFYDDSVDINLCSTPANCFGDLMVTTTPLTTSNGTAMKSSCGGGGCTGVVSESGAEQQLWKRTAATYPSSHGDRGLQSSFTAFTCDAALKPIFSHSDRQLLYDQPTSECPVQRSGAVCVYDEPSISCSSAATDTYDGVRSLKATHSSCHALLEPGCNSNTSCGPYLPTAVVAPIKRDRHHSVTAPPPPDYELSPSSPSPAKTFHLPPIETFAPRRRPRRPPASTWSWPSYGPTCEMLRRPQQQCPTVARYLMTSTGARHQLVHVDKSESIAADHFTSCW